MKKMKILVLIVLVMVTVSLPCFSGGTLEGIIRRNRKVIQKQGEILEGRQEDSERLRQVKKEEILRQKLDALRVAQELQQDIERERIETVIEVERERAQILIEEERNLSQLRQEVARNKMVRGERVEETLHQEPEQVAQEYVESQKTARQIRKSQPAVQPAEASPTIPAPLYNKSLLRKSFSFKSSLVK